MECKYHRILQKLHETVWNRIDSYYDWDFFWYWLGDESALGRRYREVFEEILEEPLTESQINLLNNKGGNLETMIGKWDSKWKENNPNLGNEKIPRPCLKVKMYEHIIYQLNKPDILQIIGNRC
jgi:hypothetical protein